MDITSKWIFSVAGGMASYFLGGWSVLLTTLLVLNAFDYITGMAANYGQLSSSIGFKGIIKKGIMWLWIVVANLMYKVLQDQGFEIGQVIPDAVAIAFIVNEIISLGENSLKLGIQIPAPIKKALDLFNDKKEEK